MNKAHFLALNEVQLFIEWQTVYLAQFNLHLRVKHSRFTPNGINAQVTGIESVLTHYMWKTSWTDWHTNQMIESSDWLSTKKSLNLLRLRLREAVNSGDEQYALKACLAVLQWGGVSGAIAFLQRKARHNQLIHYLTQTQVLLTLNGEQHLEQLNAHSIARYDSGLTKIFALLDDSGSPIYDSRVGAMAGFCRVTLERNTLALSPMFHFPTGKARGQQVRNVGELAFDLPMASEFYTKQVSGHSWAQFQVKLGWIMQAILKKGNWFKNEGDLTARCHALEACFFMCGYDLRNINPAPFLSMTQPTNPTTIATDITIQGQAIPQNRAFTWVPTDYNFYHVITKYIAFRKQTVDDTTINFKAGFVQFLQEDGYTKNTAISYCFPLSEREFDLFDRSLDELEIVAKGKQKGLEAAFQHRALCTDERMYVSLVDVFLVGKLWNRTTADRIATLIQAGFAHTEGSAKAIVSVGKNVGVFFGLLDARTFKPTIHFDEFFGSSYNDLGKIIFLQ